MDSEIGGALIGASATVIASVVTGWVAVKVKDMEIKSKESESGKAIPKTQKRSLHWMWGIAGALMGGGLVLAVLFLMGNPLFPTNRVVQAEDNATVKIEIEETQEPDTAADVDSTALYDDFNDAEFDGKWNSKLWTNSASSVYTPAQQDDVLMISSKSTEGSGLRSINPGKWNLDQLGFVEAKLMLDSNLEASGGLISIGIDKYVSTNNWWLSCYIYSKKGNVEAQANCHAGEIARNHGSYDANQVNIPFNTWHTVRFEINPDTVEVSFFVDGQRIGGFTPSNPEDLKNTEFSLFVSGESQDNGIITGYFDDIRIGEFGK